MQLGSEDKELGQASVNRWLTWLNSMDDQTEQRTTEDGRTRPGLDKRTRTDTDESNVGMSEFHEKTPNTVKFGYDEGFILHTSTN